MSIDILSILVLVFAFTAVRIKLLTWLGGLAAFGIGLVTLLFGGWQALLILFLFFFSSNLLGFWRRSQKAKLGFEKGGRRDQWQVMANGGPAALGLILGTVLRTNHHDQFAICLFAAGLAEANADTWATEIGSASGATPRSIVTGKTVPPGRSGGVTWPGSIAAAVGAALIGIATAALAGHSPNPLRTVIKISLAGLAGALFDSVLGATIQAQYADALGKIVEENDGTRNLVQGTVWIRNDVVNFMAGLFALAMSYALIPN